LSGTSVDAIDVCVAEIELEPTPSVKLLCRSSYPFEPSLRTMLLVLTTRAPTSTRDMCRVNFDVAVAFAGAVNATLHKHGIEPASVELIGSHGQTVWHEVVDEAPRGRYTHSTLQIGDGSLIAQRTGITTVFNFRTADVAAGGGGAPLVPIFDDYFLRPSSSTPPDNTVCWRALQNIGGFANVCVLSSDRSVPRVGFDSGPGNVLIDECMRLLLKRDMDRDGLIARSGVICQWLLDELLHEPYYARSPPKSTGRELFSHDYCSQFVAKARARHVSNVDVLATVTELTARTIVDAIERFAPCGRALNEMYIAGGGCRNAFLVERIRFHSTRVFGEHCRVLPHSTLLDGDAKEGLLFAFLAVAAASGVGVGHDGAILGQIAPGSKYQGLKQ